MSGSFPNSGSFLTCLHLPVLSSVLERAPSQRARAGLCSFLLQHFVLQTLASKSAWTLSSISSNSGSLPASTCHLPLYLNPSKVVLWQLQCLSHCFSLRTDVIDCMMSNILKPLLHIFCSYFCFRVEYNRWNSILNRSRSPCQLI